MERSRVARPGRSGDTGAKLGCLRGPTTRKWSVLGSKEDRGGPPDRPRRDDAGFFAIAFSPAYGCEP